MVEEEPVPATYIQDLAPHGSSLIIAKTVKNPLLTDAPPPMAPVKFAIFLPVFSFHDPLRRERLRPNSATGDMCSGDCTLLLVEFASPTNQAPNNVNWPPFDFLIHSAYIFADNSQKEKKRTR